MTFDTHDLPKLNHAFMLFKKVHDNYEGADSSDFTKASDEYDTVRMDPTRPDPKDAAVVHLDTTYFRYLNAVANYANAISGSDPDFGQPLDQAYADCIKYKDEITAELRALQ